MTLGQPLPTADAPIVTATRRCHKSYVPKSDDGPTIAVACLHCGSGDTESLKVGQLYRFKTLPDGTRVCEPVAPSISAQEPLFILPPPDRPNAWVIHYRWREGKRSLLTGELYANCWMVDSKYNNHALVKRALRRLRYTYGRRRQFLLLVWSIKHDGDIQCTVPLPQGKVKEDASTLDPADIPSEGDLRPLTRIFCTILHRFFRIYSENIFGHTSPIPAERDSKEPLSASKHWRDSREGAPGYRVVGGPRPAWQEVRKRC